MTSSKIRLEERNYLNSTNLIYNSVNRNVDTKIFFCRFVPDTKEILLVYKKGSGEKKAEGMVKLKHNVGYYYNLSIVPVDEENNTLKKVWISFLPQSILLITVENADDYAPGEYIRTLKFNYLSENLKEIAEIKEIDSFKVKLVVKK